MKASEREQVLKLRLKHHLGYGEIAKRVRVSKSTLSRWLADYPLSDERILELRRAAWSRGEAKRERFRETMRRKRLRKEEEIYKKQKLRFMRISGRELHLAGLMLYAAEGDKKSRGEIAFSNSEAGMVKFFSIWLSLFMGIPVSSQKAQLHLYENMDIPIEEGYWLKELSFARDQLCKSQIRPVKEGGFSYREPFRHGTCKLYFDSTAKKTELMLCIRAFFDTYGRRMRA